MWIRTQNKQRLVNSDQITDIFIDKTGTKIMAATNYLKEEITYITLGEYKDRDVCLKIIDTIHICMTAELSGMEMPLGGNIEDWAKTYKSEVKANLFGFNIF